MIDWVSWLSKSNLDPSVVYEYGLAFAGNELKREDIPYLNHEILQSMGVSVAKHRLEILKLARKESGNIPQNPAASKLFLKFNKMKRRIAKRFNKIFHGDSSKATPESPWLEKSWSGTVLTRNKSEREPKPDRMMIQDDEDILPSKSGPMEMMRHSKSVRDRGPSDNRVHDRIVFKSMNLEPSEHVEGRVQDRQISTNRISRLSAPPDGRLSGAKSHGRQKKEKINDFEDSDDDDDEDNGGHLLWKAVHQDIRRN